MTVATRLRGAFAIYIALLAALVIYHARTIRRAVKSGVALTEISTRLRIASTDQVSRVGQMSSDAEKYLVTGDPGYLDKTLQSADAFGRELARFGTLSLTTPERTALAPLNTDWADALARLHALTGLVYAPPDSGRLAMAKLEESLGRVRQETDNLGQASQGAMTSELVTSQRAARQAERVSWIAAVLALLASGVLSVLLVRSIVIPLERLAEGTREVSAGRFGHRLDTSGGDEFAEVSRDFNSMTARLDELDRMKRDFVAKVSHDLKTPLSSMQETISALVDGLAGPITPKQRQLLEMNLESGRRLSAMLAKLLDLSRIEAGLEPDMQLIDLLDVVRRSIDRADAALSASGRGLTMSLVEPDHRVIVRGDAAGLAQVIDNLLENAIKFSPIEGRVLVRVSHDATKPAATERTRGGGGGTVEITVADEGPGIPDDEKERVFGRFYQTEAGRSARGRGVGLGLTICREIVTAHRGDIWVTDNAPRGSIFHVMLPGAVRGSGSGTMARESGETLVDHEASV